VSAIRAILDGAVAIVARALVGIAQDQCRAVDAREIVGIAAGVRMVLLRRLAIGRGDVALRCVGRDTEIVVKAHGR
jgi:hypothetical protein